MHAGSQICTMKMNRRCNCKRRIAHSNTDNQLRRVFWKCSHDVCLPNPNDLPILSFTIPLKPLSSILGSGLSTPCFAGRSVKSYTL